MSGPISTSRQARQKHSLRQYPFTFQPEIQLLDIWSTLLFPSPGKNGSWEFSPNLVLLHWCGGQTAVRACHKSSCGLQASWFRTHLEGRSLLTAFWISHNGNWSLYRSLGKERVWVFLFHQNPWVFCFIHFLSFLHHASLPGNKHW